MCTILAPGSGQGVVFWWDGEPELGLGCLYSVCLEAPHCADRGGLGREGLSIVPHKCQEQTWR